VKVVLVGLRASGKSTVGHLLARRLGWGFLDTDEQVAAAAGRSIRELFGQEGEAGFRRRESEAVREAVRRDGCVIAAGGGAVEDDQNRRLLRQDAWCVWLKASDEERSRRMAEDPATAASRPMLEPAMGAADAPAGPPAREALRVPIYESMADLAIETQDREPEGVAREIAAWVQSRL